MLLNFVTVNALQFHGLLTDEEFKESEDIHIELVESGLVLGIRYEEAFSLALPQDTVWNLCLSDSKKEKCFELQYF
jgi:hypothetical protein